MSRRHDGMTLLDKVTAQASATTVLASFAVFVAALLVTGAFQAQLREATGQPVLDLAALGSSDEVQRLVGEYGDEGRRLYLRFCVVDVFYPLVAAIFATLLIAWLARPIREVTIIGAAMALPALVLVSDWMENAAYAAVVIAHPSRIDSVATAAVVLTRLKFGLISLLVAAVIGLAVWRIARSVSERRS